MLQKAVVHEDFTKILDTVVPSDNNFRFDVALLIMNDPIDYITPIKLIGSNQASLQTHR